jgi:hypothetical protein
MSTVTIEMSTVTIVMSLTATYPQVEQMSNVQYKMRQSSDIGHRHRSALIRHSAFSMDPLVNIRFVGALLK